MISQSIREMKKNIYIEIHVLTEEVLTFEFNEPARGCKQF